MRRGRGVEGANGHGAGTTWGWRWQRSASGRSPSLLRATVVRTSSIVASVLPLPRTQLSVPPRRRERGPRSSFFPDLLSLRGPSRGNNGGEGGRLIARPSTSHASVIDLYLRHLNRMTARDASTASAPSAPSALCVFVDNTWLSRGCFSRYARLALEKLPPADGSAMSIAIWIESQLVRRAIRDSRRIIADSTDPREWANVRRSDATLEPRRVARLRQ